ncbi:hypothetical protein [Tuwongella immobilis]|uniref:Uncharacterized protein n=1 Tax=Tuwongella immobilis TaxID=692036 RepID=A0A6C2YJ36_9BACT|nr:hypothetical protein [Tuwongella immobilis]VIP01374.1 unnamed protein product [Tuwongella immobilis]VTR98215.1 unnamed protein product [Tuwongella immobilis]
MLSLWVPMLVLVPLFDQMPIVDNRPRLGIAPSDCFCAEFQLEVLRRDLKSRKLRPRECWKTRFQVAGESLWMERHVTDFSAPQSNPQHSTRAWFDGQVYREETQWHPHAAAPKPNEPLCGCMAQSPALFDFGISPHEFWFRSERNAITTVLPTLVAQLGATDPQFPQGTIWHSPPIALCERYEIRHRIIMDRAHPDIILMRSIDIRFRGSEQWQILEQLLAEEFQPTPSGGWMANEMLLTRFVIDGDNLGVRFEEEIHAECTRFAHGPSATPPQWQFTPGCLVEDFRSAVKFRVGAESSWDWFGGHSTTASNADSETSLRRWGFRCSGAIVLLGFGVLIWRTMGRLVPDRVAASQLPAESAVDPRQDRPANPGMRFGQSSSKPDSPRSTRG